MPIPVSLRDVVAQLSFIDEETRTYLRKDTGDIVTLPLELLSLVEEGKVEAGDVDIEDPADKGELDELSHALQILETDNYLAFPSSFDIHEWAVMEEFCHSIEYGELRARLLDTIHGRRAFRHFKDAVHEYGLVQDWYQFRENALKEIAKNWLDEHQILYTDDSGSRKKRG